MNKNAKIIVLSFLVVLLIAIMTILIEYKGKYTLDIFDYKNELIYEKDFNNSDIDSFDISSDLSDIVIKKTNNDAITIKVYGDKEDEITTNIKDNNLYIVNDNSTTICLFFCMMNSRIEIMVPSNEYNNLKIKVVSGDVDIEEIIFNSVITSSKSGDIKLNKAISADIELVSGDINFNEINEGQLNTVSGEITGNIVNNISAKTISGDIKISSIGKSCQITTTSGDILISSLNILNNSTLKTISGDIRITKANDIYFDASTISGNVYIESNNRFSEIKLKISTTSGDVVISK